MAAPEALPPVAMFVSKVTETPALMDAIFGEAETSANSGATESTGDPELDAYLSGDADEDESLGGNENIDDYRDQF